MRLAVIVGLLLLAGCADPVVQDPAPQVTGPGVVTAPGDYGQDNGTAPHIHDYWQGQERIVVLDMDHADLGPGLAGGEDHVVHEYLGATDQVIPQGTQRVTVTITWRDDALDRYTAPALWVQSAAEAEPRHIADIDNGEAVTWDITAADWDTPHQRLSAWVFQLRMSADATGTLRFKGETHITVEAERGLPLPVYPAHPDHWRGSSEILLVTATGTLAYFHDPQDGGCNGISCQVDHRPDDAVIIPPQTGHVVVRLTPQGGPTTIGLEYHTAAHREFIRPDPRMEGATQVYEIPVTDDHDGPYTRQSLWEFRAYITGPLADGAAYESYRLEATAVHN